MAGLLDSGAKSALLKQPKLYAGENAQTAPRGLLAEAERMFASGMNPRDIYERTGIAVGPEGKGRFEIDDSGARLIAYPEPGQSMTLGEALHHPELFAAYPDMRHSLIVEDPNMPAPQAGAYRKGIGPFLSRGNIEAAGHDVLDYLLHELQHGTQFREGWQPGAALHDGNYRNTPGEVEAYDTQARRQMTMEQRRRTMPALLGGM